MKTILVIEDNADVRENVVEMLELAQYVVIPAEDGKQGIELARSAKPDLILCDIMMPELDGYGVLHILSKDPATATIPLVFLTAKAEISHFRNGMNLGAADYLTKPFDDIALLNVVEVRLKKGEQSRLSGNTDGLASLLAAVRSPAEPGQRPGDGYSTVRYARRQLLFADGNLPTMLYFVRRGQLKCFSTDTAGNEFITSLRSEGDFLGYEALLRDSAYDESAEVLADTDVCAIPKAEFFDLMAQNPDVATYFMRLLATDIADRNDRLLRLAYQSVRRRVADALLLVQRKFYTPVQPSGDVEPWPASEVSQGSPAAGQPMPAMALSRENWSHLVGASTETVIRTLSDLRAEGLIELTGSQITIVNLDRLIRLKH